MSDQKLLNENTIRRFMQLANTEPLADNFVNEMYGKAPAQRDVEGIKKAVADAAKEASQGLDKSIKNIQQAGGKKATTTATTKKEEQEQEADVVEEQEEFLDEQDDEEAEIDLDDDDMDMDMDMDIDADDDIGAADMSLTEEEARVLISLGERLQAAMGDEDETDDMDDMDDMDAMDDMDPMADAGDEPAMREPAPMAENEDELVQEVLRRVTKRLIEEKLKRK